MFYFCIFVCQSVLKKTWKARLFQYTIKCVEKKNFFVFILRIVKIMLCEYIYLYIFVLWNTEKVLQNWKSIWGVIKCILNTNRSSYVQKKILHTQLPNMLPDKKYTQSMNEFLENIPNCLSRI